MHPLVWNTGVLQFAPMSSEETDTAEALVERILDWTLDPAINEALAADDLETVLAPA